MVKVGSPQRLYMPSPSMQRRIEHEVKVLLSCFEHPRYAVTEQTVSGVRSVLTVSDGDLTVRATCLPHYPFVSPCLEVAMCNRDAVVRGLSGVLCQDVVSEIAERLCGDFVPAKEFFLRFYPNNDGLQRAKHIGALLHENWSPAVRIVDLVKRVHQARVHDVHRPSYPLHPRAAALS